MDGTLHYFTYVQRILSIVGLWQSQTHRQRLLRCYSVGFISLYVILGELCQLTTTTLDLQSAIRLLQTFVPALCGVAIYYHCVSHVQTIKEIYSYILQDSQPLKDDVELEITQRYAYYGNLVTFFGAVCLYSYLGIYVTSPLLRIILTTNEIRGDIDLYPIISCFDYFSNRKTYYYPIMIYQIATVFIVGTASLACYSMYFLFIQHVLAQLTVIKYKICSPFIRDDHNDDVPSTPTDLSPWIIDIVQRLAKTTEFVTMVNRVFEKSYLFQIGLAFILLTLDYLCIPVLLSRKEISKDLLALALYVLGSLFVVYLNCFIGQRLMDSSTEVYREVCLVPFHEMSLKTQKLLLMALIMNAKPYEASIGKIYVASHEFFSNLLRTSLSFAMVLHSMQDL